MQLPETVNSVLSRPHLDSRMRLRENRRIGLSGTRRRLDNPQDLEVHDSAYFAGISDAHAHNHRDGHVCSPDDCLKGI